MAVLVPLGHDGVGVLGGQGGVDLLVGVLPAQEEALRGLPLSGLVVYVPDPAAAVLIAEDALGVVDAGVHKADEHPPALQVQVGLALDLGDSRRLQGGAVQKPQHHRGGAEEGGAQGLLQVVEVLRLDVAQDVAAGEHLSDDHLPGPLCIVEEGIGGPSDEVHGVRRVDEGRGLRRQRHAQSPLSKWRTSSFMVPQRFSRP